MSESSSTKRDLTSWWKNFSKKGSNKEDKIIHDNDPEPQGIFGVPLQTSVRYANVPISLNDASGESYIYGYVPIIVAKCGVFLKEKATDIKGIFRLSGSEKRIKDLQHAFNSPDRYGKGLNWDGYTVHDAANVLRRYFNQLPEPIIPLDFYNKFRDPLKLTQSLTGQMDGETHAATIKSYQDLITQLPPLNRQLLLYILDLLAVFASKSDLNKMTTNNLAAIFQPGILSHPDHNLFPLEYKISQDVLVFLIENQDHFLIGMQGTAADEQTVLEVESGPPTPQHISTTPKHSKSTVLRSASNSSRYSGVKRSASASSRRSRNSITNLASPSPAGSVHTPLVSPTGASGASAIQRSNTLPITRSPNLTPSRFIQTSENPFAKPPIATNTTFTRTSSNTINTPNTTSDIINKKPAPISLPEKKMHSKTIMQEMISPTDTSFPTLPGSTSPPIEKSSPIQANPSPAEQATNQTGSAKIAATLFGKTQADEKKPTKLQKKRPGGSTHPSANNSTHSLNEQGGNVIHDKMPVVPKERISAPKDSIVGPLWPNAEPLQTPPPVGMGHINPSMSPAASYASHSDKEPADPEALNLQGDENFADAKKRAWFHRDKKEANTPSSTVVAGNPLAQTSMGSGFSGEGSARKSFTAEGVAEDSRSLSNPEREPRKEKTPIQWIKGVVRRMASPTRQAHDRSAVVTITSIDTIAAQNIAPLPLKGESQRKSLEVPRIHEPAPEPPKEKVLVVAEGNTDKKIDESTEELKVEPNIQPVDSAVESKVEPRLKFETIPESSLESNVNLEDVEEKTPEPLKEAATIHDTNNLKLNHCV